MGQRSSTLLAGRSAAPRNASVLVRDAMPVPTAPDPPASTALRKATNPEKASDAARNSDGPVPEPLSIRQSSSSADLDEATSLQSASQYAYDYFSCGRNVFLHHACELLAQRKLVNPVLGFESLDREAQYIWSHIALPSDRHRDFWNARASETRAALWRPDANLAELMRAGGPPETNSECVAWAQEAVHEYMNLLAENERARERLDASPLTAFAPRHALYRPLYIESDAVSCIHSGECDASVSVRSISPLVEDLQENDKAAIAANGPAPTRSISPPAQALRDDEKVTLAEMFSNGYATPPDSERRKGIVFEDADDSPPAWPLRDSASLRCDGSESFAESGSLANAMIREASATCMLSGRARVLDLRASYVRNE